MVDIKGLVSDLRKLVASLAADLLERSKGDAAIDQGLRATFAETEKEGRTAQAYEVWLDDYLDQVAVAWVLGCVFVRYMEDNSLVDECWMAGEGPRRQVAEDTHELFFRQHPHDTDREYFQHVFRQVAAIPAAKDLFGEKKTLLWAVAPSGDAAMGLLKFWREVDPASGSLKRSFVVESGDTRFLGDLYQELSERAKKKYALLQTPVFVEEFILSRTLEPAIDEFGLKKVRMIDPTCGSGHFLLGAFAQLFERWSKPEYTSGNAEKDAQNAFDGVWGVDINPFAVAIARFRLVVAAVQACGIKRLKQAPGWTIHLACGDSLLFGSKPTPSGGRAAINKQMELFEVPTIYDYEDRAALNEILGQGYHAVVGNPPYIIVRDRALNTRYRELYATCHQKYSLGVPFTQRFWELALQKGEDKSAGGYIGMITANSFMKREFGKKLIEEFFPRVDLTHVIDTSGAYIPGHGTPTVILMGRGQSPVADNVRAVLGIKGEPSTPDDASQGLVWQSIVQQIDCPGDQSGYTSTADLARASFGSHPWSIGGGGVSDLKDTIDGCSKNTIKDLQKSVGFASFPGLDDAFVADKSTFMRKRIPQHFIKSFIFGECVRDWVIDDRESALAPYDSRFGLVEFEANSRWAMHLWHYRTCLESIVSFGGKTRKQMGDKWWGWYRWIPEKYLSPLSITFAFVATHNHFVLDRGGSVFNRHAPIIKLPAEATEDDHLALLGLLNSSTACFWMKQTFHNKGSTVDQHGARQRTAPFEDFFEFTGTGLQRFPVPESSPRVIAKQLDGLSQQRSRTLPEAVCEAAMPESRKLASHRKQAESILAQMIALQEELDWQCYGLYGLLPDDDAVACYVEDLSAFGKEFEGLALGQRAFEIVMARQIAKGELETTWFERHGSQPITEIPSHWPAAYRDLVERRIQLIETNNEIGLIEKPEYKRRWNTEPWEDQEQRALKNWLLDRLETPVYRKGTAEHPDLTTTAQMADHASADADFLQVAALYRGRSDFDVAALVAELVEAESVPLLPILRYKPAGLKKRLLWERTWDLQRQEDAGVEVGSIPVPPKYTSADFLKTDYWRLRGKLDVPKERWVSLPHCSTESDPSLVVGWAGWNHLQLATALVAYYDSRKREGWIPNRLTPLLAGLDQLLPWIHQWHPEIDPEYGESAGQSFQSMLEQDAHELGLTLDTIRNWTPPAAAARKRRTRN